MNFYAYVSNFLTGWIDPFGLTEGSPENLAKRKAISNNATNAVGSNNFDFARNGGSQYPANSWKCSQFVCSNVSKAGAPITVIVKAQPRCATAGELANPRWNPKNWRILGEGEQPLPGDIAAVSYPGHANDQNPIRILTLVTAP
jgi:hypothetical protein